MSSEGGGGVIPKVKVVLGFHVELELSVMEIDGVIDSVCTKYVTKERQRRCF